MGAGQKPDERIIEVKKFDYIIRSFTNTEQLK